MSMVRGSALPNVSNPSERKNCIPPTRISGRNTSATMTIPRPPSHCRMPRHSKSPLGRSSSPAITVVPVVVTPDIDSNSASTKPSPVSPSMKGNAPKSGSTTQTVVVSRNACWTLSPPPIALRHDSATRPPARQVTIMLSANTVQCSRPSTRSTSSGSSIVAPMAVTMSPTRYPTGRTSNMARSVGRASRWCQAPCAPRSIRQDVFHHKGRDVAPVKAHPGQLHIAQRLHPRHACETRAGEHVGIHPGRALGHEEVEIVPPGGGKKSDGQVTLGHRVPFRGWNGPLPSFKYSAPPCAMRGAHSGGGEVLLHCSTKKSPRSEEHTSE